MCPKLVFFKYQRLSLLLTVANSWTNPFLPCPRGLWFCRPSLYSFLAFSGLGQRLEHSGRIVVYVPWNNNCDGELSLSLLHTERCSLLPWRATFCAAKCWKSYSSTAVRHPPAYPCLWPRPSIFWTIPHHCSSVRYIFSYFSSRPRTPFP